MQTAKVIWYFSINIRTLSDWAGAFFHQSQTKLAHDNFCRGTAEIVLEINMKNFCYSSDHGLVEIV